MVTSARCTLPNAGDQSELRAGNVKIHITLVRRQDPLQCISRIHGTYILWFVVRRAREYSIQLNQSVLALPIVPKVSDE